MSQSAVIEYGRRRIEYQIRRTRRLKTVSVAVDPVAGVLLSAPQNTTDERLARIVRAKAPWILAKQKLINDARNLPANKEFVSGETFLYLGRQYRLRVIRADRPAFVKLVAGCLEVTVASQARPAEIRQLLVDWYSERARARLVPLAHEYAQRLGVELSSVLIVDQRTRWGSCDKRGTVRFNWRIVQAPSQLVEYVVAHEVAHVRLHNHTRQFWSLLARLRPTADEERNHLASYGGRYVW